MTHRTHTAMAMTMTMAQTFVKQHYLMKKTLTKPTADGGSETIPAYAMGARSILEVRG